MAEFPFEPPPPPRVRSDPSRWIVIVAIVLLAAVAILFLRTYR